MPRKMPALPTEVEPDAEPIQPEEHELQGLKGGMKTKFAKVFNRKDHSPRSRRKKEEDKMGQTDSVVTGMIADQVSGGASLDSRESLEDAIHEKLRALDEPYPEHRAPSGWSSPEKDEKKEKSTKPIQESESQSMPRVIQESKSCSSDLGRSIPEPERSNSAPSLSYSVSATDCDIELRPEDYKDMPDDLRAPHVDVFLITSEQEEYAGRHLKTLMERVRFRLDPKEKDSEYTTCRVYLLSDINLEDSKLSSIAEAQKKCTYVFLLLTKNFCEDRWAEFQKDDAVVRSIMSEERKWGIVPLYTQPKRGGDPEKAYVIPHGLLSFKGLDMSRLFRGKDSVEELKSLTDGDIYFEKGLIAMLESRIHLRIEREQKQLEDIAEWEAEKKVQLRKERLVREHMKRLKMKNQEAELERTLKSLPTQLPLRPAECVDPYVEAEKEKWKSSAPASKKTPVSADSDISGRPSKPAYDSHNIPHQYIPADGSHNIPQPSNPAHGLYSIPHPAFLGNPGQPSPYQPMPPFALPYMMPPWLTPEQQHMYYVTMAQQYAQAQHSMPQFPHQAPFAPPNFPGAFPNIPSRAAAGQQATQPPAQAPESTTPTVNTYTYNIQASNVQIGSDSTMVTNESSPGNAEEDDADALERKYNQEWYEETKETAVEEPPKEPDKAPFDLSKFIDPRMKGRRSPEESTSPQLPEGHLPSRNLGEDAYPSDGSSVSSKRSATTLRHEPRSDATAIKPGKWMYSQDPSRSENTTKSRISMTKQPTESSELPDGPSGVGSKKCETLDDFARMFGVNVQHTAEPEGGNAPMGGDPDEQTLEKRVVQSAPCYLEEDCYSQKSSSDA